MTKTELTGKRRYRVETRLFREPLVVLQLEYRIHGYALEPYGLSGDVDYTTWRDATVESLTMMENTNDQSN